MTPTIVHERFSDDSDDQPLDDVVDEDLRAGDLSLLSSYKSKSASWGWGSCGRKRGVTILNELQVDRESINFCLRRSKYDRLC